MPLSLSRPKRAAAEANGEKILSSPKEERAAPGERKFAAASATTVQPAKRQKRAVPSSVVKVEAQKEVAAAVAVQPAAVAAVPKSAPKSVTPIVQLRSTTRSQSVEEASKLAAQLTKEQAEEAREMAEAEKAVRAAQKALKDAEAANAAVQVSIDALANKMAGAMRGRRTDTERVMDVIECPPSHGNSMLADAFDDLLTLQADAAKIESDARSLLAARRAVCAVLRSAAAQ